MQLRRMKFRKSVLSALTLSLSHATKIYVSSYSGNITTVSVVPKDEGTSNLTLTAISTTDRCSPNPSWLELDRKTFTLYCADEGFLNPTNATFSSFMTEGATGDGSLFKGNKITTLNGGVYSKIYGNGSVLALANYTSPCLAFWFGKINSSITVAVQESPSSRYPSIWALDIIQETMFAFKDPVYKQNTNLTINPYIHQAIIDPTNSFLLAPDLSADLIHVFSISPSYTLECVSTQADISVLKGHGPRHGVFYRPENRNTTYLYVVMETANMVHKYDVTYNADKTLGFNITQDFQLPVPKTAAAAEIRLTLDNKYLIVSSRNDTNFTIPNPNPDAKSNIQIPSDTLFTFLISPSNGELSLQQSFPAGGLLPRQFEINKAGTMLAVALNGDNRLVVIGRDEASGNLTGILGSLEINVGGKGPGMVTCAVWDEDEDDGSQDGGGGISGNSSVVSAPRTAPPSRTTAFSTTSLSSSFTSRLSADRSIVSALHGYLTSMKALSSDLASVTSGGRSPSQTKAVLEILGSVFALDDQLASVTSAIPAAATELLAQAAPLSGMLAFMNSVSGALASATAGKNSASANAIAVGILSSMGSAFVASATATGAVIATPSPFQGGMIGSCTKFHLVVAGDTCSSIATDAGISLSDFYTWNPAVGSTCATLLAKNNVCIGGGTYD